MNPHIELLREFSDGTARDVREPEKIEAALWVYENGYLAGTAHRPLSGSGALLNAKITGLGSVRLQQDAEKRKSHNSREHTYYSNHPIRAGIVIAVAGGLIIAVVLAYFSFIGGHNGT